MTTNLKFRKVQLETRLAELNKRLAHIEDTLEEVPDPDIEERAAERAADEVLESLGTNSQMEVQAIHAALQRLKEGTYGECAKCGAVIAKERLDLLPYAPLCSKCAG